MMILAFRVIIQKGIDDFWENSPQPSLYQLLFVLVLVKYLHDILLNCNKS